MIIDRGNIKNCTKEFISRCDAFANDDFINHVDLLARAHTHPQEIRVMPYNLESNYTYPKEFASVFILKSIANKYGLEIEIVKGYKKAWVIRQVTTS